MGLGTVHGFQREHGPPLPDDTAGIAGDLVELGEPGMEVGIVREDLHRLHEGVPFPLHVSQGPPESCLLPVDLVGVLVQRAQPAEGVGGLADLPSSFVDPGQLTKGSVDLGVPGEQAERLPEMLLRLEQESLLHRFQRMVQMSGVLREAKANRRFVSKRDAAIIKAKNNAKRKRRQGY